MPIFNPISNSDLIQQGQTNKYYSDALVTNAPSVKALEKQSGNIKQQIDFVNFIKNNAEYTDMLYWKATDAGFSVLLKGNSHTILHSFLKDPHDDFIKWSRTAYNGGTYRASVCSAKHITDITRTGVWTDTFAPNYFTTEVGATLSTTLYGNKINLYAYCDNRGGIWKFTVDGVVSNVSVWRESAAPQTIVITSGLDAFTEHTVVAEFTGSDPAHAPTGGTARGWVTSNTVQAGGVDRALQGIVIGDAPCELLSYDSNRDFAFYCTYNAVSNFIPEHSNTGTVTKIDDPAYKIDGVAVDYTNMPLWTPAHAITKFELIQHFNGVINSTNVAEFNTVLMLEINGVMTNKGDFTALVDFGIGTGSSNGHTPMLPLNIGVLETAVTSDGKIKVNAKDNSSYTFEDAFDETIGACGVDSVKTNLISAFTIDHIAKNNRQAVAKTKKDIMWASQNADYYLKVYNEVFTSASITTGYKYYWRSRFMSGEIEDAYSKVMDLIS